MSGHHGVSRGQRESMRDRRHRPMSHAPHDDSYGPQLYIPAGCSGEVQGRIQGRSKGSMEPPF